MSAREPQQQRISTRREQLTVVHLLETLFEAIEVNLAFTTSIQGAPEGFNPVVTLVLGFTRHRSGARGMAVIQHGSWL